MRPNDAPDRRRYWRTNLAYVGALLVIWFVVSYGCGILFVDALDQIRMGGFKLGFWFAQQGSIYVFVLLIFVYVALMNRLDRRYGLDERDVPALAPGEPEPPRSVRAAAQHRPGQGPGA
jgi:putative solute:sodium symporter small subunit